MNDRIFLSTRFFEAGSVICVLTGLSVVGIDAAWKISLLLWILAAIFLFGRHRARLDKPDAAHLGLGTSWLAMQCCDDGFGGVGATWAFYIPFALQIQILTKPGWTRRLWLATIPVGLVLANFTHLTPRLNTMVSRSNAPFQMFVDFAAAFIWSYYAIHLCFAPHNTNPKPQSKLA